jgi:hypothetical protein
MTIDQIRQLAPGASFKFSLPGHEKTLTVKSNDGQTLVADIVGEEDKQMAWSLVGLEQISELSQ